MPALDVTGCLGTTRAGFSCLRGKKRNNKNTQNAAIMRIQQTPLELVGLEFCYQHQSQAAILHALIQQQENTGPLDANELRLSPTARLGVNHVHDPIIRESFEGMKNEPWFRQRDVEATAARLQQITTHPELDFESAVEEQVAAGPSSRHQPLEYLDLAPGPGTARETSLPPLNRNWPSPNTLEELIDKIVRRTLCQGAALQRAQTEWKLRAEAYQQDLQQFQDLLNARREAGPPVNESDTEEGNSSDLGEEA